MREQVDKEELQQMRVAVAQEHGIALYRQYGEREAAHFLKVDVTTLKRWRRAGKVPHVKHGDGIRYLGLMIVDFIIAGTDSTKWYGAA